jgi:hypothetical protein
MKQTAAEWLIEQVKSPEWQEMYTWHKECVFDEIKAMEQKQMIEFAKTCLDKALDLDVRTAHSQVEQYYNETYNK